MPTSYGGRAAVAGASQAANDQVVTRRLTREPRQSLGRFRMVVKFGRPACSASVADLRFWATIASGGFVDFGWQNRAFWDREATVHLFEQVDDAACETMGVLDDSRP